MTNLLIMRRNTPHAGDNRDPSAASAGRSANTQEFVVGPPSTSAPSERRGRTCLWSSAYPLKKLS